MLRTLLKTKINKARITEHHADAMEDALWLCRPLMKQAEFWPGERVDVFNETTGARLSMVVRVLDTDSGHLWVSGAAKLLLRPNDVVEIASYVQLSEQELVYYKQKKLVLNERNEVR